MDQDLNEPAQLPAAPFPAPPPFWRHFTVENATRLLAIDENTSDSNTKLPAELAVLRPPPPPSSSADSYSAFSIPQALNPNPPRPPTEILLFDPDSSTFSPSKLLPRLTRSLLLNFLELTTILGNDPVQYGGKLADINQLMLNVHFVINMYRPHQAREGVKEMLQARIDAGRREVEQCDSMAEKLKDFLALVSTTGNEPPPELEQDNGKLRNLPAAALPDGYSRQLWDLLDGISND